MRCARREESLQHQISILTKKKKKEAQKNVNPQFFFSSLYDSLIFLIIWYVENTFKKAEAKYKERIQILEDFIKSTDHPESEINNDNNDNQNNHSDNFTDMPLLEKILNVPEINETLEGVPYCEEGKKGSFVIWTSSLNIWDIKNADTLRGRDPFYFLHNNG